MTGAITYFGESFVYFAVLFDYNLYISWYEQQSGLLDNEQVYEEKNQLKVATMSETINLFGVPGLAPIAQEVEKEIKAMLG